MKRRQDSILNGSFLVSGIFFLLVLGLFTNYLLGTFFTNLEDTLIAEIERETNLHIKYDSLSIGFFDTIVLEGVEVRHPEEGRAAPLASVGRAELSFRPFKLLFGKGALEENISAIRLRKPQLNMYSDTSLIAAIASIPKQTDQEEPLPPLLNCDVRIEEGRVHLYSEDSFRQNIPASPLAVLSIPNGNIEVRDNKGDFRLNSSFSVFPEQNAASGALELGGIFDINDASIDALIAFSDMFVGGVRLPDMRFFIQRDNESFALDSSTFRQVLNIEGQYQQGESGKFVLTLDERIHFFDEFIVQDARGTVGKLFFSDSEKYTPSGRMEVNFEGKGFTVESDLAIHDSMGQDVFRLRARGDERNLILERMELSRAEHLISLSAHWDWSGIPNVRAVIRSLNLGDMVFDGDLNLAPETQESLRLFASGVRVNGAPLGNFEAMFNTESNHFTLNGFAGALRGSGRSIEDGNEILFTLQNMDFGTLFAGILKSDVFTGWHGSGNARVVLGNTGVQASSKLDIVIPGLGVVNTDFSFDEEKVIVRELKTAYAALRGTGNFSYDGILCDFNIDYGGRNYPFTLQYREMGGGQLISADIRGLLHAQADIIGNDVRASFSVSEMTLEPLGFDAAISGEGSLVVRDQHITSGGSFSLAMKQPYQGSVDFTFRGEGMKFDITQLMCAIEGRVLNGSGTVSRTEQNRWNMSAAFVNGIIANGYLEDNAYGGTVFLNGVEAETILPGLVRGPLQGSVSLRQGNGFPSLSWSVILDRGRLFGIPVQQVITRANAHTSGFEAMTVKVQGDIGEISLGGGRFFRDGDAYVCAFDAALFWKGAPFPAQGNLKVQGRIGGAVSEANIRLSDIRVHSKLQGNFATRVRFADERFAFQRTGASGIEGEIDGLSKRVDLRFSDLAGTDITLQGSYGQQLELTGHGTGLPLAYLENFPEVVRSAQGTANVDYRVYGPAPDPDISGSLLIDRAALDTKLFREPLTSLSVSARFTNDILYIDNFSATNGRGALYINGQAVARNGTLEDIDARVRTDRKTGVDINIDEVDFKTSGGLLADLFVSGNLDVPVVQGRVALHDNEFYFMESGGDESDNDGSGRDNIINRIKWNLEVNALNGVSYVHPLVTAMLQPGSGIVLRNSIIDRDFDISGTVMSSRGTLDYINHEFRIEAPTSIEFRKTQRGVDPWLVFRGRLRLKDDDYEDIDIYLTFEGSLAGSIKPVFISEPPRSEREIHALLGLEQTDPRQFDSEKPQESLLYSSPDALIHLLGIRHVTKEIRQFLGLDILTIRTPIIKNILERETQAYSDEGKNLNIFRDTRFSIGKYFTSFMFAEGTMVLRGSNDPAKPSEVIPTFQLGLEFTFESFNLGYVYKPEEASTEINYEHGVEFRFRKRF